MNPLDENSNYIDPSTVSPRPTAIRYGLIWGLIGIVLGLMTHVMGWSDPSNPNAMMSFAIWGITIAVSVVMVIMAIKHHRDEELGGYITLGRGFMVGFLAALISGIIAMLWTIAYTNFIAPDLFAGMEGAMVEQWEAQGMSDEDIEKAKGYAGMFTGPTMMAVWAILVRSIWGAILGLIVAAIMKKDAPRLV